MKFVDDDDDDDDIELANSAFYPSGVGKWVPASAGKAKAGMVHFVSGWTRGVQLKLWDRFRTRAIPERLRGVLLTPRLRHGVDVEFCCHYLIIARISVIEIHSLRCNNYDRRGQLFVSSVVIRVRAQFALITL